MLLFFNPALMSQGRLLNLSCSTVPTFVLSITATTQVGLVAASLTGCFPAGAHTALLSPAGPGPDRVIQCSSGPVQAGRVSPAQEDGWASFERIRWSFWCDHHPHCVDFSVFLRWVRGQSAPPHLWRSPDRADGRAGQVHGPQQERPLQTQLLQVGSFCPKLHQQSVTGLFFFFSAGPQWIPAVIKLQLTSCFIIEGIR